MVCDKHFSILFVYKKFMAQDAELENQLFITMEESGKFNLYNNVAHLMKNLWKNLLRSKSFIFPPLTTQSFSMDVNVPGSWSTTYMKKINVAYLVCKKNSKADQTAGTYFHENTLNL